MSTHEARSIRHLPPDEAGFTLAELLVTVTVMVIVMGGITAGVVSVNRGVGNANNTMADLGTTRNTLERITQQIRGAVSPSGEITEGEIAFADARRTAVTFYSNLGVPPDRGPDRVVYTADLGAGTLRERIWTAVGESEPYTWPGAPRVDRILARGLEQPVHPTAPHVFRFFTYRDPSRPCGVELIPGGGTLGVDARMDVDTVDVTIRIREESSFYSNDAVQITGRSRLANAPDLGRVQDRATWLDLPPADRFCS